MCNSQSSWTKRQCNEQEWQKTQANDPVLKLSSLHFFEDRCTEQLFSCWKIFQSLSEQN